MGKSFKSMGNADKEQAVFCPYCGGEVHRGDAACVHCGERLPERLIEGTPSKNVKRVSAAVEKATKQEKATQRDTKIQRTVDRKHKWMFFIIAIAILGTFALVLLFGKRKTNIDNDISADFDSTLMENPFQSRNISLLDEEIGIDDIISLPVGATQKISDVSLFSGDNAISVTWKSSNEAVATVDAEGVVKALKGGECTISGTTENGVERSRRIHIFCAAPEITKIENYGLDGIKITWEKSQGAGAYQVLCKYGDGQWKKVANTEETSYVAFTRDGINKFKTCNKYLFTVRCIESVYSDSFISEEAEGKEWRYTAPSEIKSISRENEKIRLEWFGINNVHGYQVQCSPQRDFESASTITRFPVSQGTTGMVEGVPDGTLYYYRIRTYVCYNDVYYYSSWSNVHEAAPENGHSIGFGLDGSWADYE